MHNHDFDTYSRIFKERQAELARNRQREAWLRDTSQARLTRAQLLVRVGVSLLLALILVAASLYLLG